MKKEMKGWRALSFCMAAAFAVLVSEFSVRAGQKPADVAPVVPAACAPEAAAASSRQPEARQPEVSADELSRDLLVESIVQIESAGVPNRVGSKGERGLMQIKRETWNETTRETFGRTISFRRAFEPALNRQIGSAYLEYLREYIRDHQTAWKSDERSLLLASYNAGPAAVERAGFNLAALPASTRDYVARASALHDHYLREFEIPGSGTFASLRDPRNG